MKNRQRMKLLSAKPQNGLWPFYAIQSPAFFCSRFHTSTILNSSLPRFYRRKQEPETAEEIDADIELILGGKRGTPVAARLRFGTANDHDSDMGSEADVTVRPGGDDEDSEGEVAEGLLMEYTDEE